MILTEGFTSEQTHSPLPIRMLKVDETTASLTNGALNGGARPNGRAAKPRAKAPIDDGYAFLDPLARPSDDYLNILSLGAGVQSSVMALMAARGELDDLAPCNPPQKILDDAAFASRARIAPPLPFDTRPPHIPHVAVFADTGWEPPAVYKHLKWLKKELESRKNPHPIRVVTVSNRTRDEGKGAKGTIREDLIAGKNSTGQNFFSVPVFVKGKDGERTIIVRRQCTREYKLEPLRRAVRRLMGLRPRQVVPHNKKTIQWIGISTDEIQRAKHSRDAWLINRWPLIESSRWECRGRIASSGFTTPTERENFRARRVSVALYEAATSGAT